MEAREIKKDTQPELAEPKRQQAVLLMTIVMLPETGQIEVSAPLVSVKACEMCHVMLDAARGVVNRSASAAAAAEKIAPAPGLVLPGGHRA